MFGSFGFRVDSGYNYKNRPIFDDFFVLICLQFGSSFSVNLDSSEQKQIFWRFSDLKNWVIRIYFNIFKKNQII